MVVISSCSLQAVTSVTSIRTEGFWNASLIPIATMNYYNYIRMPTESFFILKCLLGSCFHVLDTSGGEVVRMKGKVILLGMGLRFSGGVLGLECAKPWI